MEIGGRPDGSLRRTLYRDADFPGQVPIPCEPRAAVQVGLLCSDGRRRAGRPALIGCAHAQKILEGCCVTLRLVLSILVSRKGGNVPEDGGEWEQGIEGWMGGKEEAEGGREDGRKEGRGRKERR